MRNVLSVDLEEYFHPSELQTALRSNDFCTLPSRIEYQTGKILDLFALHDVRATFFILGWVAERHPGLIRWIADAGHEIGCHSYAHELVYRLTPDQFRADTLQSMAAIADASGHMPRCYRAPSYSITTESMWALDILADLGFTHDSSIYPIAHDRYGIPGFPRQAHTIETSSGPIHEVPIATIQFHNGRTAPVGGGAYLRLLPYRYIAAGLRKINREEQQPACVYFHPWEIDPDQPRLATGILSRMRTYTGLRTMLSKIDRLLREFDFAPMTDVHPSPVVANAESSAIAACY
jgi:polysaccharide deacetylase family protein (PEP-CTERM system associated)